MSLPAWATGLHSQPCPADRCAGYRSCLCDDSGRMIRRTSHHDETMLFDEQGRPLESSFPEHNTGGTVHLVYVHGSACSVEAFDLDNDGLVERVCRSRTVCGPSVPCRECAEVQVPLSSAPCAAGVCPPGFSRCGCDAQGRPVEAVNDAAHLRQTTGYDHAGRVVEVTQERAGARLSQRQTVYDDRGRLVEQRAVASGSQTLLRIEWLADGSRREQQYVNGVLLQQTLYDLSRPGRETITVRDASGSRSQTMLLRQDGGRTLRIPIAPPLTEDWLTCRDSQDCRVVIDRCHCDAAFIVARAYESRLRDHVQRACQAQRQPVACPAVVVPVPVPRCVQGLCTQ